MKNIKNEKIIRNNIIKIKTFNKSCIRYTFFESIKRFSSAYSNLSKLKISGGFVKTKFFHNL